MGGTDLARIFYFCMIFFIDWFSAGSETIIMLKFLTVVLILWGIYISQMTLRYIVFHGVLVFFATPMCYTSNSCLAPISHSATLALLCAFVRAAVLDGTLLCFALFLIMQFITTCRSNYHYHDII